MSRKQMQGRILRSYVKQKPAYHRQFAYTEEGSAVLDAEGLHVYRDRENRAMRRAVYSQTKKGTNNG